ncbi:hypothetical protein [Agromyces sp. LHK192]|uniref:hypothetical protein n=1 Tax=Agromyces sp. LHK192 TaxID=2498704 RepID=UPI000FD81A04
MIAIAGLIGILVAPIPSPEPAMAADASAFDPGNIISDATFFNGAAMTPAQVQSFLNQQVVNCVGANGQPCLKDYRQATTTRAASSYCAQYNGSASESAAEIIAKVGAACRINPQVLIVTLQKERGLVTRVSPTDSDYRIAMGYACPDTAPCDAEYFGFFNQVYNAARQFQRYTQNPTAWNYQAGRENTIGFHPNAACGSSRVFIRNQATANLYIYTPYQPNAAALANLYGTGDGCSSYGNRNFWRMFTDWFGSPSNWLQSPSFEGGSFSGWGASNGFINQAVYRDARAQDGNWFAATNTPVAGRALTQDVRRTTNPGEEATASIWLRSSDDRPYSVTVVLWGLGGTTEARQVDVTVGSSWQQVVVKLPIRQSAHSLMRLDLYLQSTAGTLWVDNASMGFGQAPPDRNLLRVPSFEGSFAAWEPGNGFINRQIYRAPEIAHAGDWFAASNTPVAGRSFSQSVAIPRTTDGRYTFSIWLRNEDPRARMDGAVALWGLGGSRLINSAAAFSVAGDWTKVTVDLDTADVSPSHVKAEIYMNTVGQTLWLDDADLGRNLLNAGSFEGGAFGGWVRSAADMNVAIYAASRPGDAAHRTYYLDTNSRRAGDSLYQDVAFRTTVGDTYTAEVWVKGTGHAGVLALWALGGAQTEGTSVGFTGTDQWQLVRVALPIAVHDHTVLRFQVYEHSPDRGLRLDGAQVY